MRMWRALVVAALGTGCGSDPTLEVVVTHAAGVTVTSTTVTVYQSPSLTCEDVEFGRVAGAPLDAVAVAEATIDDVANTAGELTGMSRLDPKVIVARDYASDETLVAINCAQKGEVIGQDVVKITTLVAVQASIKPPAMPNDLTVVVALADARGIALTDPRPVSWTVYAPSGTSAAGDPALVEADSATQADWRPVSPTCSDAGVARMHPIPPRVVGGYAVQVRPAWATALPPLYTSLTNIGFVPDPRPHSDTTTNVKLIHFCTIRRSGLRHRVVCIDDTTNIAHDYDVTVASGKTALVEDLTSTQAFAPPVGQKAIAVVGITSKTAPDDRDAYVVTDKGVLVPLFTAPAPDPTPACVACVVDDAMAVPACGASAAKILLRIPSDLANPIRQIDGHGGHVVQVALTGGNTFVKLDSAGCVETITPGGTIVGQFATAHAQNLAMGEVTIAETHLINCTDGTCASSPNITLQRGAAVGFTPDHRMVATTVDATGIVLVRVKFSSSNLIVEDPPRMSAVALPDHVVSGAFDDDVGVAWDVSAGRIGSSFEIAYRRTIGNTGLPVEALSSQQAGTLLGTVLHIEADDLDGDGKADVMISGTAGLVVIPMNAQLPAPTANPDLPCTP